MANYTEEEMSMVLRLYREFCQTKQGTFTLLPEDKQVLMKHLRDKISFFDSYDSQGYVFYKRFALPYVLPQQWSKLARRTHSGEGIGTEEHELLDGIEGRIQAECLCNLWEGQIPDVCILFASVIEAGFASKVLPRVINNGIQLESKVSNDAKLLQQKRKDAKRKALRKQLGQDN